MSKKEIRIFLIAVLAIAFVSLVTQIISGVAASISLLKDAKAIQISYNGSMYENKEYLKLTGTYLLIVTVISLIFAAGMICLWKKKLVKVIFSVLLCGAVCLAFVILAVVLRSKIPSFNDRYKDDFNAYDYELFQQFLTVGLADAVAVILVFTSSLLLTKQPKGKKNSYRKYELSAEDDAENNDSNYYDSDY